jgi:histidinol-phosphate/aromatic aminotransferase/cobyric acid decarboxylase-like protein
VRQTIRERDRLARSFAAAGVEVRGSQANFVVVALGAEAQRLDTALREAGFAIKLLDDALAGWVRITMPADEPTFARLALAVERWLADRIDGGARP